MALEIYINEKLIELDNTDTIGLTFQVFSIFNVGGRSGFLSSPIKAPKTKINNEIFENLSNINSNTNFPYQNNTAKIVQDGLEIVPNGIAIIKDTSNSYNFNIFSGNSSFFDLIKDKEVNEVVDTSFVHNWTTANITASWGRTDGYIYPVIDFGKGVDLLNNGTSQTPQNFIPCFFVKTILETSATNVGFELEGTFKNHNHYNKLLVTPNKFGFTPDDVAAAQGEANTSVLISNNYSVPIGTGNIIQPISVTYTNFTNPDFTATQYVPSNTIFGDLSFFATVRYESTVWSSGQVDTFIEANILRDGAVIASETYQPQLQDRQANIQYGFISLVARNTSFFPTSIYTFSIQLVSPQKGTLYNVNYVLTQSYFRIVPKPNIVFGSTMPINSLFTQHQIDVWKDVMNSYSLVVQVNEINKKISLNQLNDITANIGKAIDWSSKIVKGSVSVKYDIPFGQKNVLKYADDEDVRSGLGSGFFNISDVNLEKETTLVELKASAVEMVQRVNSEQTPQIPLRESLTAIFDKKKMRFILLDLRNKPISLDNGFTIISNNVPFATFVGLDFTSLISNNYNTLVGMVTKYKNVNAKFILTELDVVGFDFTIPIFIDFNDGDTSINGYFYVNKISNFKRNKETSVELIRL